MNEKQMKYDSSDNGKRANRLTRILILGSGFGGIKVLRKLQDAFQNDRGVAIVLVSKDNFFLFTPMLPEASTGMIETRHIATAVRDFCKKSTTFYEANVDSIDLESKQVVISRPLGKELRSDGWYRHTLEYDYLVIALGSETNFFGIKDIEINAFTMKDLDDAMSLRNHIISMLEQAELEHENQDIRKKLMTFVVVGGGFSGVEVVGELNDFVRESAKEYYPHIDEKAIRVILVHAEEKILPELGEELGDFALQKLKENGIEVILNSPVTGIKGNNVVELNDGKITIPTYTLVWTAGVKPSQLITHIRCQHDKKDRIIINYYLQVSNYHDVYALGDCASLTDPHTMEPYPPTAQVAIRQGDLVAKNIICDITKHGKGMATFDYKLKGLMAKIGKRTGVAKIFVFKLHGFAAWWLWRTFYLANLPTLKKKIRVMIDWTVDLFYRRDVTMIKHSTIEEPQSQEGKSDIIKRV